MKLVNRLMAGQKLAFSTGLVSVDADGCVETEDKSIAEALKVSGFRPLFVRTPDPVKTEPVVISQEPVSTLKLDDKKRKVK